jgi:hypothetical protein
MRKGQRFGKLLLTTVMQPSGARFIEQAYSTDQDGNKYKGYAIILRPWKKDKWGDTQRQMAIVITWREWKHKKL